MTFSGNGAYRNKGGCSYIPDKGPVPTGRYYIADRPAGNWWNRKRAWAVDTYKSTFKYPVDHSEWFALFRADGHIDDTTLIEGVSRGGFRLHPGQISEGCITLPHQSDFNLLRNALLRTSKMPVPGSAFLAYGTIEVISYGDSCP